MKFRRFLAFLAVLCLFCSAVTANASEVTVSGTDGGNLSWTLTADGVLTISGTGEMHEDGSTQWNDYAADVTGIVLEEGVTSTCAYAFYDFPNLTSISFPSTLTSIGTYSFWGCPKLSQVSIPAGVSAIGSGAFRECLSLSAITVAEDNANFCVDDYGVLYNKDMTTLIQCPAGFTGSSYSVPDGVTTIGSWAFEYCTSLTRIFLPDGLTTVDNMAFGECTALMSIHLPDSVETIGEFVFRDCTALRHVVLSAGSEAVLTDTFHGCSSLKSVIVTSGLFIFDNSFFDCAALEYIAFTADAPQVLSISAAVPITVYYPSNNATWTEELMQECSSNITWVGIAQSGTDGDNLNWFLTGDGTFIAYGTGDMVSGAYAPWDAYRSDITSVVLEEGITSVGESAFYASENLAEVSLPSTLTVLARSAFQDCKKLEKINFPASLQTIGQYAFWGCKLLREVYVPASVTSVGYGAFRGCSSLTAITVAEDNAYYCCDEYGVFFTKDMKTLICCPAGFTEEYYAVPDGVTEIELCAFEYCTALTEVHLPEGLTELAGVSFLECTNLTSINLPGSLVSTGNETFWLCSSLKNVVIESGVQEIGDGCFTSCTSLESIIIPDGVDSIFESAFYDCTVLKAIIFAGDAPSQMADGFYTVTATAYFPTGNETWTEDVRQDYDGDITWVGYTAMGSCGENLTWLLDETGTLRIFGEGEMDPFDSSEDIPWNDYRSDIQAVVTENGVASISKGAFADCSNLVSVRFGDGLLSIGESAFSYCEALTGVSLPDTLTQIGAYAFSGCTGLVSFEFSDGVTAIERNTFESCWALETVALPESLQIIGDVAFDHCVSLKEIVIPANVTEIRYDAFDGCYALTEVYFQGDLPSIDDSAFSTVAGYYPVDNPTWTDAFFESYQGNVIWLPSDNFRFAGSNMKLGSSLTLYFYINKADITATDVYLQVVRRDSSEEAALHTVTVPFDQWESYDDSMYRVAYSGIAAKEMADELQVMTYTVDGTPISQRLVTSVSEYAMDILNSNTEEAVKCHRLMADMLNYGMAAQEHFEYGIHLPANGNMTDAHRNCATQEFSMEDLTGSPVKGPGFLGSSLTLENSIHLNFYFDPNVVDTTMTAKVSYTDHYGSPVSYTVPGSKLFTMEQTGYVGVPVDTLVAADAATMVTVEIYDGETLVAYASYSMQIYARKNYTEIPMLVELMKYCTSAYDYFHS